MDPAALAALAAIMTAAMPLTVRLTRAARRRRRLRTIAGLAALPPDGFERAVGGWLARAGWLVELRGGTGDGGIDLLAFRDGRVLAVQCKRYRPDRAVASAHVRDLYGAATALGATTAFLVTTGRVSAPAAKWIAALPARPTEFAVVCGDQLAAIARMGRWDPAAVAR